MQHLPKQSTSSCGIKKRNAALTKAVNIELWYQKAKCSTFRRNQHRVVVLKSEVQPFLKKSASSCGIKNQNAALSEEVSIKLWYQKAKCSTYQRSLIKLLHQLNPHLSHQIEYPHSNLEVFAGRFKKVLLRVRTSLYTKG
jgi:hypothetical protein